MAKTKLNIEEDEVRINPETSTEETTAEQTTGNRNDAPVATVSTGNRNDAPVATVSTGKKNVKIRATEDIDCIIACKTYKIAKDKEALVPVDVAAILCYGKKAYRL